MQSLTSLTGKFRRTNHQGANRRQGHVVMAVLAATFFPAAGVHAQPAPASRPTLVAQTRPFNIPAQPLDSALAAYAAATGVQVLYDSRITSGLRSGGVTGPLAPEEALRRLVAGTGLLVRFTGPRAATLERVQASAPDVTTLAPVTVAGEKVQRSLRDTASSVSVFGPADLGRKRPGLSTTNDVMARIPNVVTTESNNLAPAIRGIDGTGPAQGVDAFVGGIRPRITYTVDGRPLSFNEAIFGDLSLWDLERVEVFRGPQSTLQGRNSIAGAVVVKTRDPSLTETEIGGQVIVGNQNQQQYSAVVSAPVVKDELALRLAVDYKAYDSFVHFQGFGGAKDPGDYRSLTVRGKVLIQPEALPGFSTLITVTHQDYRGPQTDIVQKPYREHIPSTPDMPVFEPTATSGVMETTWKISDTLTFQNTFSLADVKVKRLVAQLSDGPAYVHSREILAEPRLQFTGMEGRLKGFAGLYFFRANQDDWLNFNGFNRWDDRTTTLAAYGEATLRVFGNLDLTLGGRFEREHRRRVGGIPPLFDVDFKETYNVFLPKVGVAWHATDELTVGATISRGYNGGGAGVSFNVPFVSYTYKPEYVWSYEAYARAELFDKQLQLTGNVFYSRYKDMQLPFALSPVSTEIRNAKSAITYGAELGARWLALPGLELFGEIGLLKTEILKYPNSGIEGEALPRSPAFTATAGASYKHSSGFDVSVDARYSSSYYSSANANTSQPNNPRGRVDPYVVVNAQAGFTYGNARVFAFVNNLFDSGKPVAVWPFGAVEEANILRPRWFGVGVQATF
ncbi:TonB-dependent receptor [Vineibacter terrae]|uniref:TonB-dependent receptor n=2 Tax=Vineibacter terrae TaxID=2586908 RepID=A0A5C8PGT1_9HYPH|nr:TonB-dependent receptor [Vineibacter terrae]